MIKKIVLKGSKEVETKTYPEYNDEKVYIIEIDKRMYQLLRNENKCCYLRSIYDFSVKLDMCCNLFEEVIDIYNIYESNSYGNLFYAYHSSIDNYIKPESKIEYVCEDDEILLSDIDDNMGDNFVYFITLDERYCDNDTIYILQQFNNKYSFKSIDNTSSIPWNIDSKLLINVLHNTLDDRFGINDLYRCDNQKEFIEFCYNYINKKEDESISKYKM